ncbi:flagellar basal body P-ring formation chaperone FlgA [Photobacterium minamisatsumaniensis]|uniref:flagellar basal body P-ring formation chaperone FlgA n=1 Tax=Photobacterium minamisatsumaniensis TaxID=2910233 RepID=UPI003D0DC4C7
MLLPAKGSKAEVKGGSDSAHHYREELRRTIMVELSKRSMVQYSQLTDITRRLIVLCTVLTMTTPAFANSTSSEDEQTATQRQITQQVKANIEHQISATAQQQHWPAAENTTISIRLPSGSHRLNHCTSPLTIERLDRRRYPAGRLRFSVSCEQPQTWKVTVQADVSVVLPVAFASQTLTRDHILTQQDITMKSIDIASLNREFIASPSHHLGLRVLRQIRDNQLIPLSQLSPAYLISRGDKVIIQANREEFSASMSGIALEGGYHKQQIRVRNSSSGKVIRAIVAESGQVMTLF